MNRGQRRAMIAMAALVVLLTGGGVLAHGGATGVVKERMDMMSALGDSMKALKGLVMGAGEPDRAAIAREAAAIGGHAETMPAKFPEGSLLGPSEARPEIWTRWPEFETASGDLASAARGLEKTAASGDGPAMQAGFAAIAKTCAACHRAFRAKK